MKVRITIENLDTEETVERTYSFDDTEYSTKPWEMIIPELIEQTNGEEAF